MIHEVMNWGVLTYAKRYILGGFKYRRHGIWLKKDSLAAKDVFWTQDWWSSQLLNDQSNGPTYNEWGHLFRFKPRPSGSTSVKAISPSYFILVKIKCLLAWEKGLDLRQNKKNPQLPGTRNDLCSPALYEHWDLWVVCYPSRTMFILTYCVCHMYVTYDISHVSSFI